MQAAELGLGLPFSFDPERIEVKDPAMGNRIFYFSSNAGISVVGIVDNVGEVQQEFDGNWVKMREGRKEKVKFSELT